jgi:hypothetical protein
LTSIIFHIVVELGGEIEKYRSKFGKQNGKFCFAEQAEGTAVLHRALGAT